MLSRFITRLGTVSIACLAMTTASLAGCADTDRVSPGLPLSPNAQLYAYLVVNGMVRGSVIAGQISQSNIQPLLAEDRIARMAVLSALKNRDARSVSQADIALRNFLSSFRH